MKIILIILIFENQLEMPENKSNRKEYHDLFFYDMERRFKLPTLFWS